MKKFILVIIATLSLIFFICISHEDSYRSKKLINEIQKDLNVKFTGEVKLIDICDYGWAEEGGVEILYKLSKSNCKQLYNFSKVTYKYNEINNSCISYNLKGEYIELYFTQNAHMDFKEYLFYEKDCILYARFHYE